MSLLDAFFSVLRTAAAIMIILMVLGTAAHVLEGYLRKNRRNRRGPF